MGTLYLAQTCMSCSSRSLLLCTIWLMANGAAGALGVRLVVGGQRLGDLGQPFVQLFDAGRALSAGIEPTTPALHCSITSLGLLMMNSGAPMIGSGRLAKDGGQGHGQSGSSTVSASVQEGRNTAGRRSERLRARSAVTLSAPSTMLSRMPGTLLSMWSA